MSQVILSCVAQWGQTCEGEESVGVEETSETGPLEYCRHDVSVRDLVNYGEWRFLGVYPKGPVGRSRHAAASPGVGPARLAGPQFSP